MKNKLHSMVFEHDSEYTMLVSRDNRMNKIYHDLTPSTIGRIERYIRSNKNNTTFGCLKTHMYIIIHC